MNYRVCTLKDRPDLTEKLQSLNRKSWPEFIIFGDTYNWDRFYAELSEFILLLLDNNDSLVGGGFTVPNNWDGTVENLPTSIENIIENGLQPNALPADTLIPVAAIVDRRYRGENISTEILKQMKQSAIERGFRHLIVPVRPTWKAKYPLQHIESYTQWQNQEGLCYDPWLRTHQRLSATILACVDSTLTIEGTIRDWEKWTGMVFPESGAYVVKHALQPVQMDVASDRGVYHEPNVWMQHPLPHTKD